MKKRKNWSSRLTYVLAVAGATVGFGATWRFPYLVGQNGGGAYVLVFCIAMLLIGIPMMLVESAIGRRLKVNSVDAFSGSLSGKRINPTWKIVGYMGLIGAFGIMSYYMVIGGWVLNYIGKIAYGTLDLSTPVTLSATSEFYENNIKNSPLDIGIATLIFVAINFIILIKGAVEGIERAAKYLMPILFMLMFIMVIRNVSLPGASEGIKFYLTPDFSKINAKLFVDVLGQVFFALSIGFGVMITLASFVKKDESLIKVSVITGVLNTAIAVLAGFMIFPSLFTFGIEPASGPSLVFKSLPIVFSNMFAGNFFAISFFSLLMIAALTTSLPIYEVIITVLCEKAKLSRKTAIALTLGGIFILGNVPSLLSSNYLSDVRFFGKDIFDAYDSISATIFFILTSLGCVLFATLVLKKEAIAEVLQGSEKHRWVVPIWFWYVKFIVPFIILAVFISSFYDNFIK
ncbi:sodium-dependent transporter [Campylobacter sp. 19-13652]|uniref:sodium-dependent transporter n=1 Tax=Campylobacter sp. 19-13652 TaxID=2840180 RepID=UPI001C74521C|nr:sodium-dependent transporter [Campylobacter sp. 19-13652]BCX79163.1 putative sodium-dependent transporter [Campylobacter sp. 19-13652]